MELFLLGLIRLNYGNYCKILLIAQVIYKHVLTFQFMLQLLWTLLVKKAEMTVYKASLLVKA